MNFNKEHTRQKQKALVSKSKKNKKKASVIFYKVILVSIIALGIIGVATGIGAFNGIIKNAPDINPIDVQPDGYSTKVFNQKGQEVITLSNYDSNRIYVGIDQMPKHLQNAFIAIEDARFRDHDGIDPKGILRAFFVGIKNGGFSEGASTITQQLIKNNVFAVFSEDSFMERLERKVQEQYLALNLETKMTKDEILESYLNTINLGQSTLGVQAASLRYFNKDVSELTLSESAVIAGITKNPNNLDPVNHPEDNKERRSTILSRMLEQKLITQAEYDKALKDNVYARIKKVDTEQSDSSVYSYFVDAMIVQVIEDLQEKKGYNQTQAYNALYRNGLTIYMTQDPKIQKISDSVISDPSYFPDSTDVALSYRLSVRKADGTDKNYSEYDVSSYLRKKSSSNRNQLIFSSPKAAKKAAADFKKTVYNKKKGDTLLGEKLTTTIQPQISFSIMDQSTGYVKALVGGRGEKTGNLTLNRATGTTRQPGSTFKVVSTYVPALDTAGLTLASTFNDAPYNWPGTSKPVRNANRRYAGYSTIRTAIRDSMNVVTAKTMEIVTPQTAYDYLLNLGFTTLVDKQVNEDGSVYSDIQYPTSLGGITNGVTNLELTASYAAIANKGVYIKPVLYTKVLDHEGNVLLDNEKPETRKAMKESTAWLLTNAMKDVVKAGTGRKTQLNNMTSAGKTGTTSNNFDFWFSGYTPYYTASVWYGYDLNTEFTSGGTHLLVWKAIMDKIDSSLKLKNKDFPSSKSITTANICSKSGKLAVSGLCDYDPRGSAVKTEYFAKGTAPAESCDVHVKLTVCKVSKLPMGPYCPQSDAISTVFLLKPDNNSTYTADSEYTISRNFGDYVCDVHTATSPPETIDGEDGKSTNITPETAGPQLDDSVQVSPDQTTPDTDNFNKNRSRLP